MARSIGRLSGGRGALASKSITTSPLLLSLTVTVFSARVTHRHIVLAFEATRLELARHIRDTALICLPFVKEQFVPNQRIRL